MTQLALATSVGRGMSPVERPPEPIVVCLHGEHDVSTALALWENLTAAIATSDDDFVVDLNGVRFLDASTIGVLVRTKRQLASQGRSLALRAPSRPARQLLEICGLTALLEHAPEAIVPATDPEGQAGRQTATPGTGASRPIGPRTSLAAPAPWGPISHLKSATTVPGAAAVATSRLSPERR